MKVWTAQCNAKKAGKIKRIWWRRSLLIFPHPGVYLPSIPLPSSWNAPFSSLKCLLTTQSLTQPCPARQCTYLCQQPDLWIQHQWGSTELLEGQGWKIGFLGGKLSVVMTMSVLRQATILHFPPCPSRNSVHTPRNYSTYVYINCSKRLDWQCHDDTQLATQNPMKVSNSKLYNEGKHSI